MQVLPGTKNDRHTQHKVLLSSPPTLWYSRLSSSTGASHAVPPRIQFPTARLAHGLRPRRNPLAARPVRRRRQTHHSEVVRRTRRNVAQPEGEETHRSRIPEE